MATRYIVVPDPITVGEEEFTIQKFLSEILLNDNRFSASRQSMRKADDIEDAFLDKDPGEIVGISASIWTLLDQCAQSPKFGQGNSGYSPGVRKLVSFIDAIHDAQKDPPEEPENRKPRKGGAKKNKK